MELKNGMICKHFKGVNLIEKNIYEIISVNPVYTGTNEFPNNRLVVYKSLFQEDSYFIREYDDLLHELSDEDKEKYQQTYRVEPLTEDEIKTINDPKYQEEKIKYIKEKYAK